MTNCVMNHFIKYTVNYFIHNYFVKYLADIQVTRDCLSNIVGHRRDIPADRFEGCRPAAAQPKLAVYVENSVRELNLKNDYWDATTYCFCEFDEWCNSQTRLTCNFFIIIFALALSAFLKLS